MWGPKFLPDAMGVTYIRGETTAKTARTKILPDEGP